MGSGSLGEVVWKSGPLKPRNTVPLSRLCLVEAGTTMSKASVVHNRLALHLSVQGLQKEAFRADAPLTQGLYTQEG